MRIDTRSAPNSSGAPFPVRWFDALWQQYDRFLNWDYQIPLKTLSLYRIALALYLLVLNSIPDLRWIADYPDEFYNPAPGLTMIWGGFPPLPILAGLELLVILAACALAVGWRTKFTSIALSVLGIMATSAYLTFGKIDHTSLVWFLPLVMAWSGWGVYYSRDRLVSDRGAIPAGSGIKPEHLDDHQAGKVVRSPGWPPATMGVLLAVAFLTAALPKLLNGWLSPSSGAARNHLILRYFQLDRQSLLAGPFVNLDWPILWELADWATVGLELSLAILVLWRRPYRWLLFFTWCFHLMNVMVFNIGFYGPTPVYPIFFLGLVNPETAAKVGERLVSSRFVLVPLLIPLALLSFFDSGLYWMLGRVLGQPQTTVDLTYFLVGLVPLTLLLLRSRGFARPGVAEL